MTDQSQFGCISFIAPSTVIDPAFWEELYERKLNIYKLGTDNEPISVFYNTSDGRNSESFVLEQKSFRSLNSEEPSLGGRLSAKGTLVNVNTIEVRVYLNYFSLYSYDASRRAAAIMTVANTI